MSGGCLSVKQSVEFGYIFRILQTFLVVAIAIDSEVFAVILSSLLLFARIDHIFVIIVGFSI